MSLAQASVPEHGDDCLDPDRLIERLDGIAAALPDAVTTAASADAVRALGSPLPGRLVNQVASRSSACRTQLLH
jgi:hypothetical protein